MHVPWHAEIDYTLYYRRLFLTHKDKIKNILKMKTSESVSKFRAGLSSSYSSRKTLRINQGLDPNVTKSVVGLDDGVEDTQELLNTELLLF